MLTHWKHGAVYTQTYLTQIGYGHDLIKSYRRSGWIQSIGRGAYKLAGDTVNWLGGVYALQKQNKLPLYAGGRTALELKGYARFGPQAREKGFIFAESGTGLPKWFKNYNWNVNIVFKATNLLPANLKESYTEYAYKEITLQISAPERAALEMLYYVPTIQGFDEAFQILESLPALRSELLQELLQQCKSVKVKRLFLYMAEKAELPCCDLLKPEKIYLGSGKRVIIPKGVLNKKYLITVNQ